MDLFVVGDGLDLGALGEAGLDFGERYRISPTDSLGDRKHRLGLQGPGLDLGSEIYPPGLQGRSRLHANPIILFFCWYGFAFFRYPYRTLILEICQGSLSISLTGIGLNGDPAYPGARLIIFNVIF